MSRKMNVQIRATVVVTVDDDVATKDMISGLAMVGDDNTTVEDVNIYDYEVTDSR